MTFDETWEEATVNEGDGFQPMSPPAPGVYDAVVTAGKTFTSHKTGRDYMVVTFESSAGDAWEVYFSFGSVRAAALAKAQAALLGVDTERVNTLLELGDALYGRVGNSVTVEVVQNGEYRNTYVRASDGGGTGEEPQPLATDISEEEDVAAADEIPF